MQCYSVFLTINKSNKNNKTNNTSVCGSSWRCKSLKTPHKYKVFSATKKAVISVKFLTNVTGQQWSSMAQMKRRHQAERLTGLVKRYNHCWFVSAHGIWWKWENIFLNHQHFPSVLNKCNADFTQKKIRWHQQLKRCVLVMIRSTCNEVFVWRHRNSPKG